MHLTSVDSAASDRDAYLVSPGRAWFAFAMTFGLMLFDYIDRQVIVSLFPHLKAAWGLSDKQLGSLVSVISLVVALGGIPVALAADRFSRVKSVVVMAVLWSLATVSCMFTRNFSQLLAARAMVGVGETGYGSVGAALIASLFPARMRSMLLGAFFAAASLGSVLGVLLGGVIAARWGWQAAFGVVGVPGLVLALLYLFVRDYRTVELTQTLNYATRTPGNLVRHIVRALTASRTMLWACIGSSLQLIVVSALWSWLPSYLNRYHGVAPDVASKQAALMVLAGALGAFVWGGVIDRFAIHRLRNRLIGVAIVCLASLAIFAAAFWGVVPARGQLMLVVLGGFLMTCTVGTIAAVVIDVIHPGVRSTGAAVLSLFQNLFGLALGPVIAGALSDQWGLQTALSLMPLFSIPAAFFLLKAAGSYEADVRAVAQVRLDSQDEPLAPATARAAA